MTTQYDSVIVAAAEANGLDPVAFRKQLTQESSLNPNAVSKKGALGIGQIMPKYWMGKHGLNTEADFKDPVKSINASAAIMGSFVKELGSHDAALVAYNAGYGKDYKNIKAFKEGRISDLPAETQDYLAKLGSGKVQAPALPRTDGVLFESGEAPRNAGLPDAGVMSVRGESYKQPDYQSAGDASGDALKHSAIGSAIRYGNPLAQVFGPNGYAPSDEILESIRLANIGSAGTKFVLNNAQSDEDVKNLIPIAQENRTAATTKRTFLGDLVYGLGEAAGDPVTYGSLLIPGGIYARGAGLFNAQLARVAGGAAALAAEGALTNLAAEGIREGTTGTDADYGMALASGAAFSVALGGLGVAAHAAVSRGLRRVEASETARILNQQGVEAPEPNTLSKDAMDRVVPNWKEAELEGDPMGALLKTPEGDTVHAATGTVFSGHNPLNPALLDQDIPMPNLNGRMTVEVGDMVARSTVPEHRAMAFNLIRTSRGYSDGSAGKVGFTAQDVHHTLKNELTDWQFQTEKLRDAAFADPRYHGVGTLTDKRAIFNERVGRAADSQNFDGLIPAELEAVKLRLEHYKNEGDLQVKPGARWGVDAPSLLSEGRKDNPDVGPARPDLKGGLRENYSGPVVYDELKKAAFRNRMGGDEGLQELIQHSFMRSYLEDPKVKARVDAYLESISDTRTAEQYARDVAYGIAKGEGDAVDLGKILAALETKSFTTKSTPDFRKMRSPFDYHWEINLPDGSKFSVNDLRSWDLDSLDVSYANKVHGDVAIAVGTGMTPKEFNAFMEGVKGRAAQDANLSGEAMAFEKIAGNLYGVGVSNGGERMKGVLQTLMDVAFMKSSAYMGLLNFSEIAAGVISHGMGFALRSVPGLGKTFQDIKFGKKTAGTLRAAQNLGWGSVMERAIRPTYRESIERTRRKLWSDSGQNTTNNVLGAVQGATSALTSRWWTTRALDATNESIIKAAHMEFFGDLAAFAHGQRKTNFVSPKKFKAASLTQEQMDEVVDMIRSATKLDADGQLEIVDAQALYGSPAAAHMRRYGQFWSERVIQQDTIGATFRWSHLPMIRPLTQFMSFVYRSLNAKLIRGNSDIIRNGDVGEAMSLYVLSPVLAGGMYMATAYLQSLKYPDERDRKKFLEERLGKGDDWGPVAAGAVKRMAVTAVPSSLYDIVGMTGAAQKYAPGFFQYAGFGKTSIDQKLKRDKMDNSGAVTGFLGDTLQNAPALNIADGIAGLVTNGVNYGLAQDWKDREKAAKGLQYSIGKLVPNDPASRFLFESLKD